MALQERSAGIILFRQPEPGAEPQYLLLDYGRYWDYAKGHVEKGEDDEAAARREVAEETGILAVQLMAGFKREIAYFFRSKRGVVRKSVCFFLGRVEADRVTLSDEHVDYAWLPYAAAMKRLKYASAKEVLVAAGQFLKKRKRQGEGVTG